MGHMYPDNVSKLMLELCQTNGETTLREVVNQLGWRHVRIECAEGGYTDRYMREMAAEVVLNWHASELQAIFYPKNKDQRRALMMFRYGEYWHDGETDWADCVLRGSVAIFGRRHPAFRALYNLPFRLKETSGTFRHPQHIES